jgi:small subunit ribosomal protein S20
VKGLPNIKSAIKRVEVTKTKTKQNVIKKSALKTTIKKCSEAIESKDTDASKVLSATAKSIDQAAAKNILHKNTAARRKSRLAKALNTAK